MRQAPSRGEIRGSCWRRVNDASAPTTPAQSGRYHSTASSRMRRAVSVEVSIYPVKLYCTTMEGAEATEIWPQGGRMVVATSLLRITSVGSSCSPIGSRLTPGAVPSLQPDRIVEMPGSADLDHIVFAGQARREHLVGLLAVHDASYRFVDRQHAAG